MTSVSLKPTDNHEGHITYPLLAWGTTAVLSLPILISPPTLSSGLSSALPSSLLNTSFRAHS